MIKNFSKLTIVLFVCYSCTSSNRDEEKGGETLNDTSREVKKDSSSLVEMDSVSISDVNDKILNSSQKSSSTELDSIFFDKQLLEGLWSRLSDSVLVYEIKDDSVYYVGEPERGYLVELIGNKIYFHLDGWKMESIVSKLTEDSLVMIDEFDEEVILFKEKSFF